MILNRLCWVPHSLPTLINLILIYFLSAKLFQKKKGGGGICLCSTIVVISLQIPNTHTLGKVFELFLRFSPYLKHFLYYFKMLQI